MVAVGLDTRIQYLHFLFADAAKEIEKSVRAKSLVASAWERPGVPSAHPIPTTANACLQP